MSVSSAGNEACSQFNDNVSTPQKIVIGFQHVLTMCPGSLSVPLILASAMNLDPRTTALLVSANLFTSGIAVLLNVVGFGKSIGSRLPLMLGSSFAPLGPMILIGQQYGLPVLFGSIIASGAIMFIISFFMDKILKLFPPVVVGSFITLIGLSLAPVAFRNLAGGEGSATFGSPANLLLGLFVLLTIVLISRYGKGMFRALSLFIGMLAGTAAGAMLGMLDLAPVANARMFEIVTPFSYGAPSFNIGAIVIMTLFCVINMIQCIGVFSVYDEVTGNTTDSSTKMKGLKAQAAAQVVAGIFSSVPSSMFSENVGLMDMTKVKCNWVIKYAGIALILLGIFPKFAALITVIPKPVLGGATLALFGIITSAGISILSKVDFFEGSNFTVIGTSIAIGVGSSFAPEVFSGMPELVKMMLTNGLFMVSISSIVLNLALNSKPKARTVEAGVSEVDAIPQASA